MRDCSRERGGGERKRRRRKRGSGREEYQIKKEVRWCQTTAGVRQTEIEGDGWGRGGGLMAKYSMRLQRKVEGRGGGGEGEERKGEERRGGGGGEEEGGGGGGGGGGVERREGTGVLMHEMRG